MGRKKVSNKSPVHSEDEGSQEDSRSEDFSPQNRMLGMSDCEDEQLQLLFSQEHFFCLCLQLSRINIKSVIVDFGYIINCLNRGFCLELGFSYIRFRYV